MKLRVLIAILAFATSWQASADFKTVEKAVETTSSNLRLPVTDNGRLSFRPCHEVCNEDYVMVRLTPATMFVVAGSTVDYVDFRKRFYNLKPGSDVYALVRYDVGRSTATSIQLGN